MVVGRAPECDIVVDDTSVSRQHAALVIAGRSVEVHDLGSRNGTLVNGQRVEHASLSVDVELMFGDVAAALEPSDEVDLLARTLLRRPATLSPAEPLPKAIDAAQLIALLSEIARTLVASGALTDTLGRVFDLLFGHVRAERGCILIRDAEGVLLPVLTRWSDGRDAEPVVSRTVWASSRTARLSWMVTPAFFSVLR